MDIEHLPAGPEAGRPTRIGYAAHAGLVDELWADGFDRCPSVTDYRPEGSSSRD